MSNISTLFNFVRMAILTKLHKNDVFDVNLICYYNTINTSGCLISKNICTKHSPCKNEVLMLVTIHIILWNVM